MAESPASQSASSALADQFLFKEYEQVCKENGERLKELWALEKFALGGAAAIAAWLLTNADKVKAVPMAWWLPFLFLGVCGLRFGAGMRHLDERASMYIQGVEARYLGAVGGYETWFRPQAPNETLAYWAEWGVALGAALFLGLNGPR